MSQFDLVYAMRKEGRRNIKDFPVDHALVRVDETAEMREVRGQIEALQTRYVALREKEQKRLWRGFLAVLRQKTEDRHYRSFGFPE